MEVQSLYGHSFIWAEPFVENWTSCPCGDYVDRTITFLSLEYIRSNHWLSETSEDRIAAGLLMAESHAPEDIMMVHAAEAEFSLSIHTPDSSSTAPSHFTFQISYQKHSVYTNMRKYGQLRQLYSGFGHPCLLVKLH